MLDLVGGLHIDVERAITDPHGESPRRRTSRLLVVWELAGLCSRAEYHQLGVIDSLPCHAGAQLVKGLPNGWGLGDGVAREGCGHDLSVAPCRTYGKLTVPPTRFSTSSRTKWRRR